MTHLLKRNRYMSSTEIQGSCLCGTVRYKVVCEPLHFFHCHCERCRKANGTGHASNIIGKPVSGEWLTGEDSLGGYKVPEAERFRTCFCTNCGSPMPRMAPNAKIVVIPAGSIDGDPPITPTARIFWKSRANWSCDAGSIPSWAQYPE